MPSAAELVQLAAGKPWLLAHNILRDATSGRWNSAGTMAAADVTNPLFPVTRVWDDHAGLYSQPSSVAGLSTIYLVIDISSALALAQSLDTIVADIDLSACGTNTTLRAEIDTLGSFPAPQNLGQDTIVGAGAGTNFGRFKWVKPDLTANALYSNQGFIRFRIQRSGGGAPTLAGVPRIGEIYVGTRRQLAHLPRMPSDEQRRRSNAADFIAHSGRRHRIVRRVGEQPFPVRFMTSGQTLAGVDEIANLRAWWADAYQGTRPFFYGDELSVGGVPRRALFLDLPPDPEFEFPKTGYEVREIECDMREMVPYRAMNEVAS